eukprot:1859051-Prymnesium_polylepis.1
MLEVKACNISAAGPGGPSRTPAICPPSRGTCTAAAASATCSSTTMCSSSITSIHVSHSSTYPLVVMIAFVS